MEVTALCIRLLMSVLLLLLAEQVDVSYSQTDDVAFPQVVPNRQQHFEKEPIGVSCEGLEGLTGWRVVKKIPGSTVIPCAAHRLASTGPCKIKNAYPKTESGEYWCEIGPKKSNTVNITVTNGDVILDSPVHPVMEGDSVTLYCRKKKTSSNLTADFFKDGHPVGSSFTGNITIHSVSTSDEGRYKCSISGAGESPESWLTVRVHEETQPSPPQLYLLLCVGLGVFLVALLLVGLLQCCRHQTTIRGTATYTSFSPQTGTTTAPSSIQSSSSPQTVSEATYAVVTKPRKEADKDESWNPVYHTVGLEYI